MLIAPLLGLRKRIIRRRSPSWYGVVLPARRSRHTRTCSRSTSSLAAGMPSVRRAVLPVPMPRITRPGASALIDAIEHAVIGAIRDAGLVTPGPRTIFLVLTAHSASEA